MTGNEFPKGWEKASLADLASAEPRAITDGPFGSNLKTAHYTSEGPRVVRLQNIGDMRFINDDAFISQEHFDRLQNHSVQTDDLLIAGLGEQLPRACLAPATLGPAIVKADCFRVRLHPEILPAYVCAILNSPQVRAAASQKISGVGRPRLNLQKVRSLDLPVPPAAEQKRIVAAIHEQFSRLEAGRSLLGRARQNLQRLRSAVLQAAVMGQLVPQDPAKGSGDDLLADVQSYRTGFKAPAAAGPVLIELPPGWVSASLEALTDPTRLICYGILMPKVKEGGTVPYVEVKDLRSSTLSVDSLHLTSDELHQQFARSTLREGDVLLAIRGSFDRAAVVPPEVSGANVSRDVARIAPLPVIDPDFLCAFLMSPPALRYLREKARGVAVRGVNIADIRSMSVPLPPLSEQKRIVYELQRINSVLDQLRDTLDAEGKRVGSLRGSILSAAFSGRLVEQDPADVPASELLDRITAKRDESHSGKHRRVRREKATA